MGRLMRVPPGALVVVMVLLALGSVAPSAAVAEVHHAVSTGSAPPATSIPDQASAVCPVYAVPGKCWSTMTTTKPFSSGQNQLLSVSCTSPSFCVAVGNAYTNPGFQTIVEKWDGSSWSTMTTPSSSSQDELFGVSCTSESFCIAVGHHGGDELAEKWDGSSWSTLAPTDSTAPVGLRSVSCTSASFCI